MYTSSFEYHRAGSVAEAVSMLGEHNGAKVLAGGHSLIPVMKLRLADPGVCDRYRSHRRFEGHQCLQW